MFVSVLLQTLHLIAKITACYSDNYMAIYFTTQRVLPSLLALLTQLVWVAVQATSNEVMMIR